MDRTDVFVTFGVPKLPERKIYQTSREGKGPDVVIEVTSRGPRIDRAGNICCTGMASKSGSTSCSIPERRRSRAGISLIGYRHSWPCLSADTENRGQACQ